MPVYLATFEALVQGSFCLVHTCVYLLGMNTNEAARMLSDSQSVTHAGQRVSYTALYASLEHVHWFRRSTVACASLDNSRLPSRRGVPETGTSTGPNGEASLAPDAPNRPPKGGGGASRILAARSLALRLSDGDLSTGPF
jgi:hypothetical protein